MRDVALGHWHYFTWNLPAGMMLIGAVILAFALGRSMRRNAYGHRERAVRWRMIGWSVLAASMSSGVVWPYLAAAARVTVDPNGTWHFANYLGVPLGSVAPSQLRELRGVDLGGLGIGLGHLEVRLADGSVIRSVRLSRDVLDSARRTLGYPDSMVRDAYGDEVIAPHRYGAAGPVR